MFDRFGHRLGINDGKYYRQRVADRTEIVLLNEFSGSSFDC